MGRNIKIMGGRIVSDTEGALAPTPNNQPIQKPKPAKPLNTRLPLGDYTERLLSKLGVTPENYVAAKAALGMAPTCNCAKRKAWLNRAGAWLAEHTIKRPTTLPPTDD